MASVHDVPVEILLEIIDLATTPITDPPCVGAQAAWTRPRLPHLPWDTESGTFESNEQEQKERVSRKRMRTHTEVELARETLKKLRLVNRYYNRLCTPKLFKDYNMITAITTIKELHRISSVVVIPYWQHIHVLSIDINAPNAHISDPKYRHELPIQAVEAQDRNMGGILDVCRNLTSLAMYYSDIDPRVNNMTHIPCIRAAVLSLLENHRLCKLGFYSTSILDYPFDGVYEVPVGVFTLLRSILDSPRAASAVQVLDLAMGSLSEEIYDKLRTKLPNLRTLTIRRALRRGLGRVWDAGNCIKWAPNANLTRLQLMTCQAAYAVHVPFLVRHFVGLRHLFISTCGESSDPIVLQLPSDWRTDPDQLCNVREPLDTLWLEHMEMWEITMLGVIPTRELVVTTVKKNHLWEALRAEDELFPHLKTLRLAPYPADADKDPARFVLPCQNETEDQKKWKEKTLGAISDKRKIELRRDARATWRCPCCDIRGF
ncbi:hypothetical protein FS842_000712 [Serendipita sp. 407]|nr:hypothetical protein FS842_000712 [Serendipita sp. 407]